MTAPVRLTIVALPPKWSAWACVVSTATTSLPSSSRTAFSAFLALDSLSPVSTSTICPSLLASTPMLTPPGRTQTRSASGIRIPNRVPLLWLRIGERRPLYWPVGRGHSGSPIDRRGAPRRRGRAVRPARYRATLRRRRPHERPAATGGAACRIHAGYHLLRTVDAHPPFVRDGDAQARRQRHLDRECARVLLGHQGRVGRRHRAHRRRLCRRHRHSPPRAGVGPPRGNRRYRPHPQRRDRKRV